ncbi:MAG: nicotinate-nucleotide adenylyltransferase [Chlamydiales bacterium]
MSHKDNHLAMQIGILGGTFDPIHFGHINLAINMMEKHQLAQILFCPARQNPHKHERKTSSSHHRINMLRLVIEEISNFKIIETEINREGPSYTIDTLRYLRFEEASISSSDQLRLIVGEDVLPNFHRWKDYQQIIDIAPPLIGTRSMKGNLKDFEGSERTLKILRNGLTPIPLLDISATSIRERVAKNQYIGHLTFSKVIDYITQNQLYLTE